MQQYFFILGHNPTLSVWEVVSVLNQRGIDFKTLAISDDVFFIETSRSLRPAFLERLGGTISIVEFVQKFSVKDLRPETLLRLLPERPRVVFGFSVYRLDNRVSRKSLQDVSGRLKKLGLAIKKELRASGKSARFISGSEIALSSASVEHNKLLEESGEWVFFLGNDRSLLLGRTMAVQKASWYSWRDYGRPSRDVKGGMLPPKLAKILVNLSGVRPLDGGVILDPFCGSGTIIQEAGILGFNKLMCLDRDPKAINSSRENWAWLCRQGLIVDAQSKLVDFKLADAQYLSGLIVAGSVEAIVSEGYLGPAQGISPKSLAKIIEELSELYLRSFGEFKKILKVGGRVVITLPVFRFKESGRGLKEREHFLPITDKIRALGFKSYLALPATAKKFQVLQVTDRGSVIYGRPDQRVWREVFVWKK